MEDSMGSKVKGSNRVDVKAALLNLLNSSDSGGNQYVTFTIGEEEYGIEITSVQEITAYRELAYLPNVPPFVKGILNLRGKVIPVMDPRLKFGLAPTQYNSMSVIVIFEVGEKVSGMIVDKISDVLTIDKENIEETPDVAVDIDTQYIDGIGKIDDRFVTLLNINKIFTHEVE